MSDDVDLTGIDSMDTSSHTSGDVGNAVADDLPAAIPEDVPDIGGDGLAGDAASDGQENLPEDVSKNDDTSSDTSGDVGNAVPDDLPAAVPEDIPEDTSADTAQDTHEDQEGKEPLAEQNEVEARLRDDIKDNPEYFDEKGGLKWPENDGFEGEPSKGTLQPGRTIDRYGPDGVFTSQAGTPYEERSLPFDKASQDYNAYDVVKPIERVLEGETAPAFNQKGRGTQQKLPESVEDLVDKGFLKRK